MKEKNKKIRCEDVPRKNSKKRKGKGEREYERVKKKILLKEMSVRVLYYLGIFGVSVCRFLNWEGPSLVIVYVRPKSLFFMSGKFVVEKKFRGGYSLLYPRKNSYRQTSWVFVFCLLRASRSVLPCYR